ncbi:MAG TPA: TatD family hydrolase [Candidatus Paceibacterota bacterium]
MLFDSHCHLHFSQFDNDREEIIRRLKQADIKVINVGTDLRESEKAIELSKKYPDFIWASVGLHPNDNLKESFSAKGGPASGWDYDKYRELAKNKNVVAIGECGLDYFRLPSEAEITKQKEIFIKQIELAKELNKPIILHCRPSVGTQDAYEDAINIIENLKFPPTPRLRRAGKIKNYGNGVAHFFSGSKETAEKFLDSGFYISFAGPITFASEYKEVVEFVPIDKILIETDAPFAAPLPYRGQRNEPAYVEFVARKIAEWKRLSFKEVADKATENAIKLFKIK